MSNWTTITLELRDADTYFENNDGASVIEDTQNDLHSQNLQVYSTITDAKRVDTTTETNHNYLVMVIGDLPAWEESEALLENLREYSTGRAVVIHANDTSSSGVAKLYEYSPANDWDVLDVFDEQEQDVHAQTGMKAAAVMYVRHDIPATSMTNPNSEFFERDDYSAATALNQPR